jgi:hypothetical protein
MVRVSRNTNRDANGTNAGLLKNTNIFHSTVIATTRSVGSNLEFYLKLCCSRDLCF